MRSSLVLSCGLLLALAACSFKPSGEGGGDDASPIDADNTDACIPGTETCEGTDQDCDGLIDEGFTSGAPCDGPDTDVCLDDMTICNAQGQEVCGNTSNDDDVELCNAADDDCDGAMDEGFSLGTACDGADTDMCMEGMLSCDPSGTGTQCLDTGDNDVETCNMADEDCDGVNDNGFDLQNDEQNCGTCGTVCVANMGTNNCTTGTCTPVCNVGAANCDGNANNGCELTDTNPQCVTTPLTTPADVDINGDVADTEMVMGTAERLMKVRVHETTSADVDLTARFALASGAGTNYDLFVYCPNCASAPISDTDDAVEVGRDDVPANDRTFEVYVEVRLNLTAAATSCAAWTLTVTGNVTTANRCGN